MENIDLTDKNMALYIMETCPYCNKVRKFLEKNNIKVNLKDINKDNNALNTLVEKTGGKRQVPCLIKDGNALYESDDIINWFKDQYLN